MTIGFKICAASNGTFQKAAPRVSSTRSDEKNFGRVSSGGSSSVSRCAAADLRDKLSAMKIKAQQKIVFTGDSITDCGRARPHGSAPDGLGNGYVQLVDALLSAANPELEIEVWNTGISGNTVRDLKARWNDDVLSIRPDWLSIMIGTNDVWRQFDSADDSTLGVLPDEYENTLCELVSSTRSSLSGGLVVMTPFFVDTNASEPMRVMIEQYGAIAQRVAAENDALFVDTQAAFDAVMQHREPSVLAGDKVHPSVVGHIVLARAFLQAIDFTF